MPYSPLLQPGHTAAAHATLAACSLTNNPMSLWYVRADPALSRFQSIASDLPFCSLEPTNCLASPSWARRP